MRKYFLYTINDPILNIPKYVGISNDPKKRFIEHLLDKAITKKTKWLKTLNQQPILNILQESENINIIIQSEINFIINFKDLYNLTNTTSGGEYLGIGKPINVYDLNFNFLDSFSSLIEACEFYKLNTKNYSSISANCLRKRNYAYNKIWRYANDEITEDDKIKIEKELKRKAIKKVYQYDLNKNLINIFNSITECKKNGFSQSAVSQMLSYSAKNYTIKNFIFCNNPSEFDFRLKLYINTLPKKVIQYDLNENLLKEFDSIHAAALYIGNGCDLAIKKCCENKRDNVKGYKWKYKMRPL